MGTTRYRYGETNPVMSRAVGSSSVIAIGDLCEATAGVPIAAADHVWNTNLATTQEEFHDKFAGVACQRSRSGDTDPIRLATEGVFEFDCASATFEVGDLVGPAKQSGNALENQKVVAVATANLAIGRVAEAITSGTRVKVRITAVLGTPSAGQQAMA